MRENKIQSYSELRQYVYDESIRAVVADRVLFPDELLAHESSFVKAPAQLKFIYKSYSWAAHSLKARSWLWAVFVFNLVLMSYDYIADPDLLVATLIVRGVVTSAILIGLYIVWGKPRADWVLGATLVIVAVTVVLEAGSLGMLAGQYLFERYLTAGLFTVASAIMFFPIHFSWTIAAIVAAISIHSVMIVIGPVNDPLHALGISLFYSAAILTFASTRKAALKSQWQSFKSKIRELRDQERLAQFYAELQVVANLDPLTSVLNRRSAQQSIDRIWHTISERKKTVAFLMLDIDDFKKLNDTYGHSFGDECIKSVASKISESVRDKDLVSRYGGEEFLVVLTASSASSAFNVAERIRTSIEALRLEPQGSQTQALVTVSIGLALWAGDLTPQMLINRADEALYRAKKKGKNQTAIAPPPTVADTHFG